MAGEQEKLPQTYQTSCLNWKKTLVTISCETIDTTTPNGREKLIQWLPSLDELLSNSYQKYYGKDYHRDRILNSNSHVFLILETNGLHKEVIGLSYVKQSGRRGSLAIKPNRRLEKLSKKLISISLSVIPKQYSIVQSSNIVIRKVLSSSAFVLAVNEEEVHRIAGNEAQQFFNFRTLDGLLMFDRVSHTRKTESKNMCMYSIGWQWWFRFS